MMDGDKVMSMDDGERVADRQKWLCEQIPKRNTKIDNSPNRGEYLELIWSKMYTLRELEEIARGKEEKISKDSFHAYMKHWPKQLFREPGHIELMTEDMGWLDGIDSLKETNSILKMQRARIEGHAAVDEKSPIARREQSNDIRLYLDILNKRDELIRERKGEKPGGEGESGQERMRSIDDMSDEEWHEEELRQARIILQAEEDKRKASREGRFDRSKGEKKKKKRRGSVEGEFPGGSEE